MNSASTAHIEVQKRATRALLKFCGQHGYQNLWLKDIRECLSALEAKNVYSAVEHFQAVPLGGNGCFNDWWPPVVFDHEDEDYVWAVFEALVAEWSRLMQLSVEKKKKR